MKEEREEEEKEQEKNEKEKKKKDKSDKKDKKEKKEKEKIEVLGGYTILPWAAHRYAVVKTGGFAATKSVALDQLQLFEGELVSVCAVSPKGWWEGEVVDPSSKKRRLLRGWFPESCVRQVDLSEPTVKPVETASGTSWFAIFGL